MTPPTPRCGPRSPNWTCPVYLHPREPLAAQARIYEGYSSLVGSAFYVTTSGHSHFRTLFNTISEIGVDRVMFSVDYPYETMEEAAGWFDTSLLAHNDSVKVGRENAWRASGAALGVSACR
jgi:predicted TIM-barrel fold metal-dependent hydrolase